jgi:hypothetical protein
MGVKLTQDEVVRRIKETHGDTYDLSKFIYTTQRSKSIFICKIHGEFLSQPKEVWGGTGCPECGKEKFIKPISKWENVIEKLNKIHGDEYKYFPETYKGVSKRVKVKCKTHNYIWTVRVMELLKGEGCPKCRYVKSSEKLVLKVPEFIKRSRKTHGDKYDYSKVHQFKQQKKERVTIICPTHGEFKQKPFDHWWSGSGCPKCWEEIRSEVLTSPWEEVIKSFRETHGDKYQYNRSDYINSSSKLRITCPKHGEFLQDVTSHKHGQGCPKCGRERISEFLTTPWEEVLKSFRETHKNEYEYTPETYTLLDNPMEMFCKKHGRFEQTPKIHRKGSGCPECGNERTGESQILSWEEVLKSFREVHRDEYDYNEDTYTKTLEKMEIICRKHGVFLQTPMTHKQGKGCPVCSSSTGEKEITHLLNDLGIEFEHQKKYKVLGRKRFDFYIPSINTIIEYNGIQHYEPKEYFGGEKSFKSQVRNDKIKKQHCLDNGINYEIIRYDEDTKLRVFEILETYKTKNNSDT